MYESPFFTLPPKLAAIQVLTAALGFTMASERGTGNLLQVLAASKCGSLADRSSSVERKPGGRFLELGTGTGIATAWLLSGMDQHSTLISIDNDPKVQSVAREILGGDPRLTLLTEDAETWLRNRTAALSPAGEPTPKPEEEPEKQFDLIFADAMPVNSSPAITPSPSSLPAVSMSLTICSPNPTGLKATPKKSPRSSTPSLPIPASSRSPWPGPAA